MTNCSKAPESIHLSQSDAAQFHRKYGHEKLELVCVGDPCETYHHADTVTALQAEVDRLREAARAVVAAADKWNAERSREAFEAMSRSIDATRAALNGDDA